MARPGRIPREEQTLPPNIQKCFITRANGANWEESAKAGGTTAQNLRKWRNHPDAGSFMQQCIQANLMEANTFISDNAPALAARLVEIGLDRSTRPYAAIQAIAESFKIISNNIADKENRDELKEIKQALDKLEGGNTYDIFAETSEQN